MAHVRRDLAVNFAMSVVSVAAMMLALREAARLLPSLVLGLMLLSRRIADLLANLVLVGTPLAVRRYLSLTSSDLVRSRGLHAVSFIWSLAHRYYLWELFPTTSHCP